MIHYHGHNSDGNDMGRIIEAVINGAKIIDAADHAFTGFFGPPPIITVVDTLGRIRIQSRWLKQASGR